MAKNREQSTRLRLWLWRSLAVVIVLVFLIARYLLREQVQVRAAQVHQEVLSNTISTNGRVEPEHDYAFYSPISTTVKAVYVQPGEKVRAGTLLMVLDDVDARAREATAQSGVKSAQAALDAALHNGTQEQRQMAAADLARAQLDRDQAQHDLDALTKLSSTGAASPSEVNAARGRLQAAEGTLHAAQVSSTSRYSSGDIARAQASVADAEAGLAAAKHIVDQTIIRAPIAGTVYSISVAPTEYAEQGKLLIQVADLTKERVRGYFDEPDIGHLAVGQSIVIKWDAKQGQEWHGRIERVPSTVEAFGTRHVGEALISLEDADGGLLPDTNVNVTVTTSTAPNTLTIPHEALFSQDGRAYVFKIENNHLVRTDVTPGIVNLTRASILSGLKDGDWIATGTATGQSLPSVQDGVSVKVVP